MKTEHWITIFLTTALCLFVVFAFHVNIVHKQNEENIKTERDLLSACTDGLSRASDKADNIFENEGVRQEVTNTFYATFSACLNRNGSYNENMVRYYVPFIILSDTNGYYVQYTRLLKDSDGTYVYKDVMTDINAWSVKYDIYTVEYQLGENVTVRKNGDSYNGYFKDVYETLGSPNAISFMADEASFLAQRNEDVADILNEQIDYYMNTHNELFNDLELDYRFVAPKTDADTVTRIMDKPSVIAFAQGIQYSTGEGYINVYALTSTILQDDIIYHVADTEGEKCYHVEGCGYITESGYTGTLTECAKMGAYPCPYCIN